MFCDEDLKLIDMFFAEMVNDYPQLDGELIYATCRQAVELGVEDISIVWEWLQNEI